MRNPKMISVFCEHQNSKNRIASATRSVIRKLDLNQIWREVVYNDELRFFDLRSGFYAQFYLRKVSRCGLWRILTDFMVYQQQHAIEKIIEKIHNRQSQDLTPPPRAGCQQPSIFMEAQGELFKLLYRFPACFLHYWLTAWNTFLIKGENLIKKRSISAGFGHTQLRDPKGWEIRSSFDEL